MEIVEPVMFEGDVSGTGRGARRFYPGDLGELRNAGRIGNDVGPMRAAVARDLQISVVGSHPDQPACTGDSAMRMMVQ